MYSRTRNGQVTKLGHLPPGMQPNMSISGSMLTGVAAHRDYTSSTTYWWKLGTRKHGHLDLPSGASYVASAPDGAIVTKGDELLKVTTSGKVTSWGTPIPGADSLSAVSDDHGVVVTGRTSRTADTVVTTSALAYMRFADPGRFTSLDYSTTDALWCTDVDKVVAACHTENDDGAVLGTQVIPLGGTPPTTTTSGGQGASLIGDTAIWSTYSTGLQSISLGDATVKQGPETLTPTRNTFTINGSDPYGSIRQFGRLLVAGLGKVAVSQGRLHRVMLVSSVNQGRVLQSVPRSRAAVSAFGVTSHEAVYAGDTRVSHHHGRFSAYRVAIAHHAGRASFGPPRLLHANADYGLAGVSKQVRVYATRAAQEHSDLEVVFSGKTHTIDRVAWNSYLVLSGTRVMYAPEYRPAGGATAVYDAATGKTTRIDTNAACCDKWQGRYLDRTPALSGTHVYWVKPGGSVWQHNLLTGNESAIFRPRAHAVGGIVFAAGDRVAWTLTSNINHPTVRSYVRRTGGGGNHAVPGRVVGVSSAGVLTTNSSTLGLRPDLVGSTAAYIWRPFEGKARVVLTKREVFLIPKLVGHTMAWVDLAGRLRVKDL